MTFYELVKKNRSYRGYNEDRRIIKDELLDLVECARLCPSTVNIQPLKYYLVWEKDEVDQIQKLTSWAKALPHIQLPHQGMCPTAFVIICQDLHISDSLARFQKDIGIVAQTMLLAATDKGLGGCCIGSFNSKVVCDTIRLPEYMAPMLIVAFGEPSESVILTEVGEDGNTKYYRNEQDMHFVPKRKLQDIVLTRETIFGHGTCEQ